MTLIVGAVSADCAVVVGDRLVTVGDVSFDPDYDKLFVWQWDSITLAIGLTGLAYGSLRADGYGLHLMVAGTLQRAVCDRPPAIQAIERVRDELTRQFGLFDPELRHVGLTLLTVGFTNESPFAAVIRNQDDRYAPSGGFEWRIAPEATVVGWEPAVDKSDFERLSTAVAARRSCTEMKSLALQLISRAAKRPDGRKYIGRRFNAVVVDQPGNARASFHAHGASVAKHPALITPTAIAIETFVESPESRRRRGHSCDGKVSSQFSLRGCPEVDSARIDVLLERSAGEVLRSFLAEHAADVPGPLRPVWETRYGPDGSKSESWAFPPLPADLRDIRELLTQLIVTPCDHPGRKPAVCGEARRLIRGARCAECSGYFNGYQALCLRCGRNVCSNGECATLVGDRHHAFNSTGDVEHIP